MLEFHICTLVNLEFNFNLMHHAAEYGYEEKPDQFLAYAFAFGFRTIPYDKMTYFSVHGTSYKKLANKTDVPVPRKAPMTPYPGGDFGEDGKAPGDEDRDGDRED